MENVDWKEVLKKAVEIERGQAALSSKLKTTQQNISWALREGKQLPPTWVLTLSEITGVPPHKLRPDIFSNEAAE